MRSRLAGLVALGVLAACGTSAGMTDGGSAARARSCGPSGAKTTARTSRARIYTWNGGVYGCAFATRRSYRLGSAGRSVREARVGPTAIAGVDGAYGLTSYGVDAGSASVVVRRLTDGHQLRSEPSVSASTGPESFQTVDGVVVKADGAVAWIASSESIIRHSKVLEVHKTDGHGPSLLDRSAGIDPGSLRRRRSVVNWRDGAQTRTATLD